MDFINLLPVRQLFFCGWLGAALCFVPIESRADAPATTGSYRQPMSSFNQPTNNTDDYIETSPKPGWRQLPSAKSQDRLPTPWWAQALLWIPNRVMDFIDIFRIDIGIGPAIGGVIRVSKPTQAGYRRMLPFSFRVGDFGRRIPFLLETKDERNYGRGFRQSPERIVCNYELGLGLDLVLGGYAGICGEELLDFFAGLIFIDLEADDID